VAASGDRVELHAGPNGGLSMRARPWLTMSVLLLVAAGPAPAQPAPDVADAIRVTIKPPRGTTDGKLTVFVPKAKILEEVRKAIPESVALPDQRLGNQLIYRDVQLNKVKAVDLKPSSLSLQGDVFRVEGTPTVTGDLNALYEHVVITTEVRTVAKVFGREVKQSVPVVKSDWRPKGAAPFAIKVEVRGTARVSVTGNGALKDHRLHLETRADHVKIVDVRLHSDDLLYKIVKELVGVVGKAFPNEGLNKPIKDGLTRGFDIDPFQNMAPKDREQFGQLAVKNVAVNSTDSEVKVTADLTGR
jgi:hypothetical protein